MTVRQPIFGRSMFVDAEVTAGQLVKITGDESVSPATAGTDVVVGVAMFDGVAGDKITVELFCKGVVELVAGGTVTAGAEVAATTGGTVLDAEAENSVFGVALNGGALDSLVKIMVK